MDKPAAFSPEFQQLAYVIMDEREPLMPQDRFQAPYLVYCSGSRNISTAIDFVMKI